MSDPITLSIPSNIYLTIPEVAKHLRVSQRTLYRWLREGRLKCFRVGNTSRIAVQDLEAFVQANTEAGVTHVGSPYGQFAG